MFNQQEYINNYIKEKYKTVKIRIKNSDTDILEKLEREDNINQYIISLIRKDIQTNTYYNFINDDIKIDFTLSETILDLIRKAEEADKMNRYGLYMNYVYAIDSQAKKETTLHIITESQWHKLLRRYKL